MNKTLRLLTYGLLGGFGLIILIGLILAFAPAGSSLTPESITPQEAAERRSTYDGAHHLLTTSDGETLFMRRWNPDTLEASKAEIAILFLHGITAHSGAYQRAGELLSAGGYTTFGLDYRGHGLSGGNRADYPDRARWVADMAESVDYIKKLSFEKVIILGHSLGVAATIYVTQAIPEEIAGLVLLSGAYQGREGVRTPPSFYQKARILSSSVFRPSVQVVEYYREGMTGLDDPLFNFRYTLRFLQMLNVEELQLPASLNVPTLVATGDKDELFEVDKVREVYDDIPGDQKDFLVLADTYHARFPDESWNTVVRWLDDNF